MSALIQHELIDEFHLFINPTAIGNGLPIFNQLDDKQPLTLVKSTAFDCGIVVLRYEPNGQQGLSHRTNTTTLQLLTRE